MGVVRTEEPIIRACLFEILRSHSSAQQTDGVSGYIEVSGDETSFETINDLCLGKRLDRTIVVYKNHAFSLDHVTFRNISENAFNITLDSKRRLAFNAKDVQLKVSSGS